MNLQIKTLKKENIITIVLLVIILFSIGLKHFKPDIFNSSEIEDVHGFRIVLNSNLLCTDGKVNIFAENKSTNKYKMEIKIYDNRGNVLAKSELKIGKKLRTFIFPFSTRCAIIISTTGKMLCFRGGLAAVSVQMRRFT